MTSSNLPRWVPWVATVLLVLPVSLALVVTWQTEPPPAPASANLGHTALAVGLLLAVLLGGALALLFLALAETAAGGPPSLETSWGGFGGGLGGWNLSPALTYLLVALFLGGLFGVLANRVVGSSAFQAWAGIEAADTDRGGTEQTGAQAGDDEDGAGSEAESPSPASATEPPATPDTAPEG